ncbi:MAG: cupin domain-containing protein [Hydrogenophaga sp.]|uniref:cupin domain-containing protein n=1 Tax=Hydrogenophaga sp. TaxID=1904254 RepID=UPI001D9C39A2|nr:cupin domain-containing protein [Hydrogenophaga sp.]MBX3608851.1 cupin domain-containing protein [Hydrogenophaga sp.]
MNQKQGPRLLLEKMAHLPWKEYPGHFGGALSKELAGPDTTGSSRVDFRISRYAPMASVQEHVHKVQEQIYYVLEGEGVLTLDDQRHLMHPHDYVFVPPGVRHSFTNTGTAGLVFLVITTPASDEEEVL